MLIVENLENTIKNKTAWIPTTQRISINYKKKLLLSILDYIVWTYTI